MGCLVPCTLPIQFPTRQKGAKGAINETVATSWASNKTASTSGASNMASPAPTRADLGNRGRRGLARGEGGTELDLNKRVARRLDFIMRFARRFDLNKRVARRVTFITVCQERELHHGSPGA